MSNLIVSGFGTNSLILGGLGAESPLVALPHPAYVLTWDGETDRWFADENGPVRWLLTRSDGADIDTPEIGALRVYDRSGAQVLAITPDTNAQTATTLALSQLITLDTGGLYHVQLALTMPDGTVVTAERRVYVLG